MRALLEREGIFAGVSSGAVVHVARRIADELPDGSTVVCVLADGGWKYISADFWKAEDVEDSLRSCAILTTTANSLVAPLHDRMPVILPRDGEAAWLDSSTPRAQLPELLAPLSSEQTSVVPVGPAVNDARYDGPECLAPAPTPARTQPTLF